MHTLTIPYSWTDRRPVLLDRFLYIPPLYDFHDQWVSIPWQDSKLFGNDHPVFVEYCSGNGQWIVNQALRNPSMNWVAVEKRFDRSRLAWKRLKREGISNLLIVCGEGEIFTRHYAPLKSLSGVYVNFPDPWSKRYQQGRRILNAPFLEGVERLLLRDAFFTYVTDDPPYNQAVLELFKEKPLWQSLFPAPFFVTDWPDYGHSFFKGLWQAKGRQIYYQKYLYV